MRGPSNRHRCSNAEVAKLRIKEGFRLIATGTDVTLLREKIQEVLTSLSK